METLTCKYVGNLRTEYTHLQSGGRIHTDAPSDNHGKGEAFSPTDLVATALVGCILTTMGISGQVHDFSIDGATASAKKIMGVDPRRIVEIVIDITLPHADYDKRQRAFIEASIHACPVGRSLHSDLKQTVTLRYGPLDDGVIV